MGSTALLQSGPVRARLIVYVLSLPVLDHIARACLLPVYSKRRLTDRACEVFRRRPEPTAHALRSKSSKVFFSGARSDPGL
jgi:hypothetical protein